MTFLIDFLSFTLPITVVLIAIFIDHKRSKHNDVSVKN